MSDVKKNKKDFFNENRIYDYVKKFSFPRLAGTEGEKIAVAMTVDTFKEIGFKEAQIEREPFEFSDFYSTTLIKLIMSMSLIFVLLIIFSFYIYVFFTISLIITMAIVVSLIMKGLKHPEKKGFWGEYFGDTFEATNVIVKIPAKNSNEKKVGDIVISAHLDSKSQTFKTGWRIVLYRVWLFSGILLGGVTISYIIWLLKLVPIGRIEMELFNRKVLIIDFISWILASLIIISNIFLMFLNTHNKSPGALDNASGMAIVFELSSYFKDHPLKNFNLWFCQFSAEELGTMGSRIFVNNREDQFIKGKIFQINLDMVSAAGLGKRNCVEYFKSYGVLPRKKIAPILSKYLERAAAEENIFIRGFHLTTGAHLDSVPFHLRGYSAVDISTRAAAKWTHDITDTPDKVDPKVLRDTCYIVRKMVLLMDKEFNELCSLKR
ncbi:MAG: M28 family peptidase [Promethearchaeia archaeon]